MYSLQLVIKQFGPLCPFFRLKCHRLAPSIKIISRHTCQAKHKLDIHNDKHIHFKYYLSRSSGSQTSGNFKIVSDSLDKLNVQQIESGDCKNIIFDLVSSYFNLEEQICQNEDTFMILYLENKVSRKCNDFQNLQQYKKNIVKSIGFQKFLEILPSHFESMSVGDMVDVYGGLLMLGIPKTDSVMTRLFCKFSDPGVVLGLPEIGKLSAIFDGYFSCRHILQFTLLAPALNSLLVNCLTHDKEGLKSLSYFMRQPLIESYPVIIDTYLNMLSVALNDNDLHQDVDCASIFLNGVCECLKHQGMMKKQFRPDLVEVYVKLMDMLNPHIEHLTYRQFSFTFSQMFTSGSHGLLLQLRPHIYRKVINHSKKKMAELINSNLPVKEKLRYMLICNIPGRVCDEKKFVGELLNIIPDADELTLLSIAKIMNFYFFSDNVFNKTSELGKMLTSVKVRLLELLHSRFSNSTATVEKTNFQKFPYHPYILILGTLQEISMKRLFDFMFDFQPFLAEWLESGYACDNHIFSLICQIAMPVLDEKISLDTIRRVEDTILSQNGLQFANRFVWGAMFIPRNKEVCQRIEMACISAITKRKQTATELVDLICIKTFAVEYKCLKVLARFIAEKMEKEENVEECFLSVLPRKNGFLSENMTNRILKYYTDHFNETFIAHKPDSILLSLLMSYDGLSRLPKHFDELEQLSQHVFDRHLGQEITILKSYQMLYYLCNLGIYLDEHIQKVFTVDYLKQFYAVITGMHNKRIIIWNLRYFVMLNRHIVLHRTDLNIPWMSEKLINLICSTFDKELDIGFPQKMRNTQYVLEKILGGDVYYKSSVTIDYGLKVDYEYFVDSHNVPVIYNIAKKMDLSKTNIRKCAVHCGRRKRYEFLANDENALSVMNAQKILDLKALGYEVVFIPVAEWLKLPSFSNTCEYMRDKMSIGRFYG